MNTSTRHRPQRVQWDFPLRSTHAGALLGNGTLGLMVWGEDALHITFARAGFWDHRGGNPFVLRATFRKVRALLEAGDEVGLRALFEVARQNGVPDHPQQMGGGRLEVRFGRGFVPRRATLDLENARLEIELHNPEGERALVTLQQAVNEEVACLQLDTPSHGPVQVRFRPAWEFCGAQMQRRGLEAPRLWEGEQSGGFVQTLPDDAPLGAMWWQRGETLLLATRLDSTGGSEAGEEVREQVKARLEAFDWEAAQKEVRLWWRTYWESVPRVEVPDPVLQHFYDYGLYKQAGLTPPQGVAATLQGAWMEEYQLPPWSNDYHFNINVQMIYWPALATNRLDHLAPLWAMIREWMPQLRANGEAFFERAGALMLPHAVDDRCQVVGTFWSGTIDHACTAWMAQLAWLHASYGGDEEVLREVAWPLLTGAFEGYHAMLEWREGRLSLPLSVSPEYRVSQMNAWGRDASFQLAALHRLTQILPRAAGWLGEPVDPRWAQVAASLPPYSLVNNRIGLWEGLELEESHRHHSHLAGLWPFMSLDPLDAQTWPVVARSLRFWSHIGAGEWTGWCVPWASILCARCHQADAAVAWLHWMFDSFVNEGYGTLHNACCGATTAFDNGSLGELAPRAWRPGPEVMQADAGMGALSAVLELLVQDRRDGIHILPCLPRFWRELCFDGVRCEGAFFVGATVHNGRLDEVRVQSERGGQLSLSHGLGEDFLLNGEPHQGARIERVLAPREELVLRSRA